MAVSAHEKLDRPVDSDDSANEADELRTPRSSEDARRHDQETLNAEDEAERLLGGGGGGERIRGEKRSPRKQKRRKRREGEKVEESELMYAMEEGGRGSEGSSGNSSEVDLARLREVQGRKVCLFPLTDRRCGSCTC